MSSTMVDICTYFAHIFLGIFGLVLNLTVLVHMWTPSSSTTRHKRIKAGGISTFRPQHIAAAPPCDILSHPRLRKQSCFNTCIQPHVVAASKNKPVSFPPQRKRRRRQSLLRRSTVSDFTSSFRKSGGIELEQLLSAHTPRLPSPDNLGKISNADEVTPYFGEAGNTKPKQRDTEGQLGRQRTFTCPSAKLTSERSPFYCAPASIRNDKIVVATVDTARIGTPSTRRLRWSFDQPAATVNQTSRLPQQQPAVPRAPRSPPRPPVTFSRAPSTEVHTNELRKSALNVHIVNGSLAEILVSALHCGGQLSSKSTSATVNATTSSSSANEDRNEEIFIHWLQIIRPLGLYAVAFITAAISIDRYLAVLYPLHHSALTRTAKRTRARLFMLVCWTLAVVCSLSKDMFLLWETPLLRNNNARQIHYYELFHLTIMYFLPALVVCFCYVRIFCALKRSARRHKVAVKTFLLPSPPTTPPQRNNTSLPREHHYARLSSRSSLLYAWTTTTSIENEHNYHHATVASLNNDDKLRRTLHLSLAFVGTFLTCTLPYATIRLVHILVDKSGHRPRATALNYGECGNDLAESTTSEGMAWCNVQAVLLVVATSHCIVNPILYGRQIYKAMMCNFMHKMARCMRRSSA